MHGRDAAGVQCVGNGLSDADDALFRVRGMEIRAAGIGLRGVGMDDKDERPLLRAIERESPPPAARPAPAAGRSGYRSSRQAGPARRATAAHSTASASCRPARAPEHPRRPASARRRRPDAPAPGCAAKRTTTAASSTAKHSQRTLRRNFVCMVIPPAESICRRRAE